MKQTKHLLAVAISMAIASPAAFATNGMNMEGYGPIATGMGGASMAYDNGTAAMMNNPATLSLMDEGSQLDLAFGALSPSINSSMTAMPSMSWDSKSNMFYMPAAGYAQKSGKLTWGVGAFAQGGMGTEYDSRVSMGPGVYASSPGGAAIIAEGVLTGTNANPLQDNVMQTIMNASDFSEVGVMRILFPVSYQVDDKLNVGGSIDYVRASMDIRMGMPGSTMSDMMIGASGAPGSIDGLLTNLMPMFTGGVAGGIFDFADSNPYTGATSSDGFAAKIGFTYKVNPQLTIGGTYHSKTSLGDLSGDATLSIAGADVDMGGGPMLGDMLVSIEGKMKVKDFQWPQTLGLGMSYQVNDKFMIAADLKHIGWADVMSDFKMSFVAGNNAANQTMSIVGYDLNATLFQDWADQTVIEIGGSYQVTPEFVVRAGLNKSDNPIPNSYLNYLFPAIIKDHYMVGFGYTITNVDSVDFSYTYAPKVSEDADSGMTIEHSQSNWQLMYSHSF